MRATLPIFGLLFLVFHPLPAQISDHSRSLGFVTTQQVVEPVGNGQWLTVDIGMPYEGAWYSDTLFAIILDQQGEIVAKNALAPIAGDIQEIYDLLPLADSSFVIAVATGECDASSYKSVLRKHSLDGQLIWELEGLYENDTRPPLVWKIAPDGNLLGFKQNGIWPRTNEVWKVDVMTGLVLWKATLAGLEEYATLTGFDLIPGTENIVGIGNLTFEIWEKTETPAGPGYIRQNALGTANIQRGLGFAPNGWYYTLNEWTYQPERFNANLEHEILNTVIDLHGLLQMAASTNGLYFLGRQDGQSWLRRTDFLGQTPLSFPMPDHWLRPDAFAVQGDDVAVVGTDGSGPKSIPTLHYRSFQALQLWTRTFSGLAPVPSTDTVNAAVSGLQQLSKVDTTTHFNGWSTAFSLQGGDFRVQITNRGATILDEAYVNFSYEQLVNSFCFSTLAKKRFYSGLQLAPGESVWVNFGDLAAQEQSGLPSEFCFWTSSPNGQPDAHHEDDHFCIPAAYTVPTNNPFGALVKLLPNPANDYFQVLNANDSAGMEWQLYNATGRLMQQGIYPSGQSELTVSTEQLPTGLYLFKINGYISRLIVQH